ncbi:MAG: IS630 family transposase [Oscillospiraceae bacterium]|nr:IS630 family transposase [Oscillospiraceae bacterium]
MKTIEKTDYRTVSSETLYEARKTVIRMWKSNKGVAEIIEATSLSQDTVYVTIRKYKKGGMAALKPKSRGRKTGEKRSLTPKQEKEILSQLVDKNPDQLKLKGCMWTRDNVKDYILRQYGIDMPIRTVGEYLRRWGLTVQRPAKQEANQKPEQVEAWLKEQYPAIHAEAKAENAEIFWGDETAVQNVANYARGYAPKGKTPVVKIQAKKMHINMISAISNQGKLHFLLYSDAINSERLISFMEAVIKTAGKKVYLILDNLRVHHSKAVTAWVEEHSQQIRLFHLPPYSPEYNPDEYLNNDLKRNLGTQAMVKDVTELEDNTNAFMSRLSDDEDHVKAYFDHPALSSYKLS